MKNLFLLITFLILFACGTFYTCVTLEVPEHSTEIQTDFWLPPGVPNNEFIIPDNSSIKKGIPAAPPEQNQEIHIPLYKELTPTLNNRNFSIKKYQVRPITGDEMSTLNTFEKGKKKSPANYNTISIGYFSATKNTSGEKDYSLQGFTGISNRNTINLSNAFPENPAYANKIAAPDNFKGIDAKQLPLKGDYSALILILTGFICLKTIQSVPKRKEEN